MLKTLKRELIKSKLIKSQVAIGDKVTYKSFTSKLVHGEIKDIKLGNVKINEKWISINKIISIWDSHKEQYKEIDLLNNSKGIQENVISSKNQSKPRIIGFIFLCIILIFMIGNNKDNKKTTIQPAFNYDVLLTKNIDEIRIILGAPLDTNPEPSDLNNYAVGGQGIEKWDNIFHNKEGKELLATFNPKTRSLIDLFVSTRDPKGYTNNKQELLDFYGIDKNSSQYTLEFVKTIAKNDSNSNYTGIKILKK